jgi:hypothetical protein
MCFERVETRFGLFSVGVDMTEEELAVLSDAMQQDNTPGVVRIHNGIGYADPVSACGGSAVSGHQQWDDYFCYVPELRICGGPDPEEGYAHQYYYRARLVDSCEDCQDSGLDEVMFPEGKKVCCDYPMGQFDVASCEECEASSPTAFCSDFGFGCYTGTAIHALACVTITQGNCSTYTSDTGTAPTYADCLEATGLSVCQENPFP